MKKETFAPGETVIFDYCWYGRTNPHDGHRVKVLSLTVEKSHGRNYWRYVVEDLDPIPARAKKIFKVTDSSANGTTLRKP